MWPIQSLPTAGIQFTDRTNTPSQPQASHFKQARLEFKSSKE